MGAQDLSLSGRHRVWPVAVTPKQLAIIADQFFFFISLP